MADLEVYKSVVSAYRMLTPRRPAQFTQSAQSAPPHRLNRCGTIVDGDLDLGDLELDEKAHENQSNEVPEYGFGCPFSYWEDYTYYPYVCAKYSHLKDELLHNNIENISIMNWNSINTKAEKCFSKIQNMLGQRGDKNTPFAHDDKHWTPIMNIKPAQKISLSHILSILFYTDLNDLPRKMKGVCRKLHRDETVEQVRKRHSELTNWLRYLFETIVLYGDKLSVDDSLYHGLNQKFYFKECKAKFYIPTSTTEQRSIAMKFANDPESEHIGIVLEFGGIETVGDPYFQTASLSKYSEERECLFFFAEMPIKSVWLKEQNIQFDMSSLSLYQSIINGNIIIDKVQSDKKHFQQTQLKLWTLLNTLQMEESDANDEKDEKNDSVGTYGKDLLQGFVSETDQIYINANEIISKIKLPKLRAMFITQDGKSFTGYSEQLQTNTLLHHAKITINNALPFSWKIDPDEINAFLNDTDSKGIPSQPFRCPDSLKLYCQMNKRGLRGGSTAAKYGRISLFLYKLPKNLRKTKDAQVIISFDLYCKKMSNFYCRFHEIALKLKEGQGVDFELDWLRDCKALKKKKPIEWEISIRIHL
eukprot:476008_1